MTSAVALNTPGLGDRSTAQEAAHERLGLSLSWETGSQYGFPGMAFASAIDRRSLAHLRSEIRAVGPDATSRLEALSGQLLSRTTDVGQAAVVELDNGSVALVELTRGSVSVEVAARDRALAEDACRAITSALGVVEQHDDEVPLTFWALGAHGPRSTRRMITAPPWDDVQSNYTASAAAALQGLMVSRSPGGGRLILWHGPPGTGKTNALKALSRSWQDWCATHFITDPEAFLGAGTSYLMDVLTAGSRGRAGTTPDWKLLVLEDAGELLTADAHVRTGQALSRLLNVTDGLVGQGLNALVLVTTNEPLGKLHPAVHRAGRCWAEVEFEALSDAEASRWLATRGCSTPVMGAVTLADLFASLDGRTLTEQPSFGFAAA